MKNDNLFQQYKDLKTRLNSKHDELSESLGMVSKPKLRLRKGSIKSRVGYNFWLLNYLTLLAL